MIPNPVQRSARHIASDDLLAPCAQEGGTFREDARDLGRYGATLAQVVAYERQKRRERWAMVICLVLLLVVGAFAKSARANVCDWSNPGADRYTGDVREAVEHYKDIPPDVRHRLAARVYAHAYDDVVTITAGAITGKHAYRRELRDMHYGTGRICTTVTRAELPTARFGLAYTDSGFTIIVPNDCANVSRGDRLPDEPEQPTTPARPTETALDAPIPSEPAPPSPPIALAPPVADLPPSLDEGYSPVPVMPALVGIGIGAAGLCCCITLPPPVPAVPEPSSWLLMLAGGLAIWLGVRVKCRDQIEIRKRHRLDRLERQAAARK